MAPPVAATTVVACVPGSVSPVEVIGSGSGGAGGHHSSSKNCYFNEDTFKLIECVKARPALWHRKHLRQRVQVALRGWEEIRKAFNASEVTSLKVRWKTLRDSFRREVKRIEDREIATSSWPLFDRMSFLIGHFRTRESYLKSGTSSPNQSKSNDHWNYSDPKSQESQTDEEPVHNATSSMGESENEVVESFVVYANQKATTYETVVATNVERLEADGTARAAVESDPDDLTMIETYETVHTEEDDGNMEASSSRDVIELPTHMFGEVTFKNKLRARIKTEPVEVEQRKMVERDYGFEADSDYNFLMSLHPFMKKLPGKKNLSVRIKIQQMIADAMDEN